ncbi:MAG: hypothetical protein EG828_06635 [Deltaproteobacteria bacterium]|nr:hypothetical protein [Deltaproteobacteria bacterium]
MDTQTAIRMSKAIVLDGIIKAAVTAPRPTDPYWSTQPKNVIPITFSLIEDKAFPLALQRRILEELAGDSVIGIYSVADDPQFMYWDRLSTFDCIVMIDKAYEVRDRLIKELPAAYHGDITQLIPSLYRETPLLNQLSAPPALTSHEPSEVAKDTFGPLRTDAESNVWCNGIPLLMPDRFRLILAYFIRYPKFHKLSDISRELYPSSQFHDAKATHTNIEKYVSYINSVLAKHTDDVRLTFKKHDLAEGGYQLDDVPRRKPRTTKPIVKRKIAK